MIINNTILDDFGAPTVISTWVNNDGYGLTTEVETLTLRDMKPITRKSIYI